MLTKAENHMSWLLNGKADITFSAVVAAAKLYLNGIDLRMKSINVWDNFYLLTRGYKADNFGDLKGNLQISIPKLWIYLWKKQKRLLKILKIILKNQLKKVLIL